MLHHAHFDARGRNRSFAAHYTKVSSANEVAIHYICSSYCFAEKRQKLRTPSLAVDEREQRRDLVFIRLTKMVVIE